MDTPIGVIVQLIAMAVCGVIAAVIARQRGRSVVGWFFGGFFLQIIGIVVVAVLPNPKAEAAYRERAELENRRLREQIRQERLKSETYRQHSMQRLDAHDAALGMDTKALAGPGAPEAPRLEMPDDPFAPPVDPDATLWYYESGGEAKGPVEAAEVMRLLSERRLAPESLVWSEGMVSWAPAKTVPLFARVTTT